MENVCLIPGCGKPAASLGWCRMHYTRYQRHGDPLFTKQPNRGDPEGNFLAKVNRLPNDCWEWIGAVNPAGYGTFTVDGKGNLAHKWAYTHWVGPVLAEHTLDHTCHNRARTCPGGPTCPHRRCVNPAHLVPKPLADNVAESPNAQQNRTHCPHGHEFTEANTYLTLKGHRGCRACHAESERLRQEFRRTGVDRRPVRGNSAPIAQEGDRRCEVDGCDRKYFASGMCQTHYHRERARVRRARERGE